ncbi:uncharacterized protein G2W53_042026 [Senna tora]|uniref:Uncharacterized protein n=1 Tax=Senna tora TaxID=362788 RepID=A0A834SEP1_9FABA|nr:uncharacterized protein G2W53_042026 [Senna tora]
MSGLLPVGLPPVFSWLNMKQLKSPAIYQGPTTLLACRPGKDFAPVPLEFQKTIFIGISLVEGKIYPSRGRLKSPYHTESPPPVAPCHLPPFHIYQVITGSWEELGLRTLKSGTSSSKRSDGFIHLVLLCPGLDRPRDWFFPFLRFYIVHLGVSISTAVKPYQMEPFIFNFILLPFNLHLRLGQRFIAPSSSSLSPLDDESSSFSELDASSVSATSPCSPT